MRFFGARGWGLVTALSRPPSWRGGACCAAPPLKPHPRIGPLGRVTDVPPTLKSWLRHCWTDRNYGIYRSSRDRDHKDGLGCRSCAKVAGEAAGRMIRIVFTTVCRTFVERTGASHDALLHSSRICSLFDLPVFEHCFCSDVSGRLLISHGPTTAFSETSFSSKKWLIVSFVLWCFCVGCELKLHRQQSLLFRLHFRRSTIGLHWYISCDVSCRFIRVIRTIQIIAIPHAHASLALSISFLPLFYNFVIQQVRNILGA